MLIVAKILGKYFRKTFKKRDMKLWITVIRTPYHTENTGIFPQNYFENITIKLNKTISVQNSTSNSGLAWLFERYIKKLNKNLGRVIKYRVI